jgi:hypothetical protein
VVANLGRDIRGQVRAAVEHRQHDALDGKGGIEVVTDEVERGDQLGEALQGVVLALGWDQHRLGRGEGIDGQQTERWRAIDEDVVVVGGGDAQDAGQTALPLGLRGELDLGSGERHRRRRERHADDLCRYDHLGEGSVSEQSVVEGGREARSVDSEPAGRVALRIEVEDEDSLSRECERGRQIDYGRRLADAALLVGTGDRLTHSGPPRKSAHEHPF